MNSNKTTETDSEQKKRRVVVPGEIIISGEDYLPSEGTRREGNDILASRFGIAEEMGRVIKVMPVSGAFVPRRNQIVLGRVTDINHAGWLVDIDWASTAFLPLEASPRYVTKSEMDQYLNIGDVVMAKIWNVKAKGIDLSLEGNGLGRAEGGFMFKISTNRVPRVIGRDGSMVNLIKNKTSCDIAVAQNGWVWIKGQSVDSEIRARKAVEYVVDNFFVQGLTEKMEEWFNSN
ncbi:MAG TPA: KH domain-containing protein [Candidatus Nanoarchaeia archaeon]|nr:KH domain-containing protein [Candidatus Nanoarchaeia archaeon]